MLGGLDGTYLQRLAQALADREKAIIDILLVFLECYPYKSRPPFEQFVSFVCGAEALGYSTRDLRLIFASGKVPGDLDALIVSFEFIESIQQLQTQAGMSEAELDDISQGILRLAEEIPQPAKTKQRMPYYQRNKAQWWKGRRPV